MPNRGYKTASGNSWHRSRCASRLTLGTWAWCMPGSGGGGDLLATRRCRALRRRLSAVLAVAVLAATALSVSSPAGAQDAFVLCDASAVAPFNDVDDGDYAAGYILCAKALGLSEGIGGNDYAPDAILTRGQIASFLVRLWEGPLNKTCPTGQITPFTDIGGSAHESNIVCLHSLGITKGTASTAYSPRATLTTAQMTRFIARLLNEHEKGTCVLADSSELADAAACLERLNIAPDTTEAAMTDPAPRSQMAVYLIGAWRQATGGALPAPPSKPPEASDSDEEYTRVLMPFRDDDEPPVLALASGSASLPRVKTTGSLDVPVFFCGTLESTYTPQDLTDSVEYLNETYSEYLSWQSSGNAAITYTEGSVLSLAEFPANKTVYDLLTEYDMTGRSACIEKVLEKTEASQIVILTAARPSSSCVAWYAHTKAANQIVTILPTIVYSGHPVVLSDSWLRRVDIPLTYIISASLADIGGRIMASGDITHLADSTLYEPAEHDFRKNPHYPPMLCFIREKLGWPIGGNSPPCLKLPPDDYTASMTSGSERLTVNWTEPAFTDGGVITGYKIKLIQVDETESGYSFNSDDTPVAVYSVGPDERSHTFYDLLPFTRYAAYVLANSNFGTPLGESTDALLTQTTQAQVTNLKPRGFTLTWNPLPGVTEYLLHGFGDYKVTEYVGEDGATHYTGRFMTIRANTVTLYGKMEPDTTYTIFIDVCDVPGIFGCHRYTSATATTPALPPQPPGKPRTTSVKTGKTWIEFAWEPTPGTVAYHVTHRQSRWWFPVSDASSVTTGRIGSLQPGTDYTFEIRSCVARANGETHCGIPATVTVTTPGTVTATTPATVTATTPG